ncbi:MAG: hypothetical protein GTO71_02810 [Woeseiaceae bacterium]|nr:hypothetical protein [Woeseiaceae bacterium]NIP20042.1 hypothetical protein [Woeseiaceae bacterium]NIS88838.1 hypothetical protein [Woeseiaceae bacterium]
MSKEGPYGIGRAVCGAAMVSMVLLLSVPAAGQQPLESMLQQPAPIDLAWRDFLDIRFLGYTLLMLVLAAALGALMAFHPRRRKTARTLEDIETPHVYTIYAVVGAIVGIMVVRYGMVVGFVLFGIGGLIRFRTLLQSAARTGRVILVTLIGLACGLQLPHVAVIATVFGYTLIAIVDSRVTYRLTVKGVNPELFCETGKAYEALLDELGCRVLSAKRTPEKLRLSYIFRCPSKVEECCIGKSFENRIDPKLRATPDWEID